METAATTTKPGLITILVSSIKCWLSLNEILKQVISLLLPRIGKSTLNCWIFLCSCLKNLLFKVLMFGVLEVSSQGRVEN